MQVNPMQLIQMIKSGQNPQQLLMSVLQQQASQNPMSANLLQLMQNGNFGDIESIARNLAKERGIDFDKEFSAFKRQFGVK